jgi:hypothetical protein
MRNETHHPLPVAVGLVPRTALRGSTRLDMG